MSRNTSISAQQYAHEAYQRYGQYVVGNRAVADYRDGLKPVQRRILWAMHEMGLHHGKPYTKSANTVGTVLARYHPHGDTSVYDALVGLATCRYPLVDGQGNFGSPDGDKAAAYRYTESRLHRLTGHVIGTDDSILNLQPNFDDRFKEPIVMGSELPVLLLNGCSGIAVGIASEIPPHNLREIVQATIEVIKNPKADLDQVMQHVLGPDYGAGVLTSSADQVREVYEKGEGQLGFRCLYELNANELVITQYAPRFSLNKFIDTCQQYVEAGNLQSVTNKSSKKTGIRIVVNFTNPRFVHDHVIPMLETSISFRFFVNESTANDGAQTMQLGLVELLRRWSAFRIETEKRIIAAQISRLDEQIIKTDAKRLGAINLQKVARIVSSGADDLEAELAKALPCSREVAKIILDLPLRSLAKTQIDKIDQEIADLKKQRASEEAKLKNIKQVVIEKLTLASEKFGDDRIMQVRQKRPKLELPADSEVETWLACNRENGKVIRLEEAPDKRRGSMQAWDQLIQTGPFFWVVLASGQMQRIDTASLVVGKPKSFGELAGIISSAAQRIVVMDETGEGLVIDAGALIKDKYQSMKTTEKVVRAQGMKDTSCLFAWNKTKIYCHKPEKLETTRVNSGGWKLLPKTSTNGAKEILVARAVDGVLSIWDGKLIYGQCNAPPTEGATSGRCYVEWDDGSKTIASAKTIKDVAEKKKIVKMLGIG